MREPTEMELRVARIIEPVAFGPHDPSRLSEFYVALRNGALKSARAAIRAMREPTKNMITCGDSRFYVGREQSRAIWQAMIDAASPPDSGEG